MSSDDMYHKTWRIVVLAITMCVLGGMFFAYKVNACAEKPPEPVICKEEFFQVDSDHPARACSPGAKAEWITSPPAPRPGIMCHCFNDHPAPAAPAQQ